MDESEHFSSPALAKLVEDEEVPHVGRGFRSVYTINAPSIPE